MPGAALRAGAVDRMLPLDDIAGALRTLVERGVAT
jgi:chemotaxis response regulator CheB